MGIDFKNPDKIEYDPAEQVDKITQTNPMVFIGAEGQPNIAYDVRTNTYWRGEDNPFSDDEIEALGVTWDHSKFVVDEKTGQTIDRFPPTTKNIAKMREKLMNSAVEELKKTGENFDVIEIYMKCVPRTVQPSASFKAKLRETSKEDRLAARLNNSIR